ncbi:MaoC family dehydratase [Aliikangiella maris]|uniref:MaoC family dehydratase n=2 Tax=Aliikangiella maris TaxID=3162458 RepID=A0ABV3MQQ7_9GAMM
MTIRQVNTGNLFEDFHLGQKFNHGVPRTLTQADASIYLSLTGQRFALNCSQVLSKECGFKAIPIDNLLVFHIAFGKTVTDISLHAIANLGYAEVKFETPVFAGDTIEVTSEVIGLKQNSNGQSGIVYVHSLATNQAQQTVVSWIRWVMVPTRIKKFFDPKSAIKKIPHYQNSLHAEQLIIPTKTDFAAWRASVSDYQFTINDLNIGDELFHQDGITINAADHMQATHLYQNNARVHFNRHQMQQTNHQTPLVYGGHVISLCRAISYNGLANTIWLVAINSGEHTAPTYADDTIYCYSTILDKQPIEHRHDVGLIRIALTGYKNLLVQPQQINATDSLETLIPNSQIVLKLDYWALMII